MEIVSNYGIYMGVETEKDSYKLQRAPVTFTDRDQADTSLHDYAKAIPNTVFLLINETHEFLVKGTRWDGVVYHYAEDAVGMDVSALFTVIEDK